MQRGYLRRIESLFGFRIGGGHNLNNIRHRVDDKHGRKTTGPPRLESKGNWKEKNINCKKTKSMNIIKRNSLNIANWK